jgi:hypothetical protein
MLELDDDDVDDDDDDEDVACTVDDMEATDRLQSLVQRDWSEGTGDKSRVTAVETPTPVTVNDCCLLPEPVSTVQYHGKFYRDGIICFRLYSTVRNLPYRDDNEDDTENVVILILVT